MIGLPGVAGDGMPGKNVQRKLGTTRGSPRRSRTAKASRISRYAAKSRCVHEWGGWGRLSDDGPGHYNPDPSEDPWGMWSHFMWSHCNGGAQSSPQGPTQCGANDEVTRRAKDGRKPGDGQRNAGSRLKLEAVLGRPRPKGQPSSRTGENSPYGMIGGIEEAFGIIRSPVRASILPDLVMLAPGTDWPLSRPFSEGTSESASLRHPPPGPKRR